MTPHRRAHRDTHGCLQVRGEGIEPPSPGSKPGGLPLTDPRSVSLYARVPRPTLRVGARSRTRLASLEGWHLCRSAKGTQGGRPPLRGGARGVEPPRLIARPFSKRLPSPIGLTFLKAAATGIEPVSRRLTAAGSYQHELHRNSVGTPVPPLNCLRGGQFDRDDAIQRRVVSARFARSKAGFVAGLKTSPHRQRIVSCRGIRQRANLA